MSDRNDSSGNPEQQYQPGSHNRVLVNIRGIIKIAEMQDVERVMLANLQRKLLDNMDCNQGITTQDLCRWHYDWLNTVYDWAGRYRTVSLQKGNFLFATATFIDNLMSQFERRYLSVYTPCRDFDDAQLIEALAVCHVELIIISPFRDGNGSLSRILATMMAAQAGRSLLDYRYLTEHEKEYFTAIYQGHSGNYEPMKRIFAELLQASKNKA